MIKLFKSNTLIFLYAIVFACILIGVYINSGSSYIGSLSIYFISLIVFYAGFQLIVGRISLKSRLEKFGSRFQWKVNPLIILGITGAFVLVHLIVMGGSPSLMALQLETWEEVALLRESIGQQVHPIIGYGSSITIKAVLPFFLLYLLAKDKKTLYWIFFVIAFFYAFSLMQKSFVVGLLLPSLVYSLYTKKYLFALKYIILIPLTVVSLSKIANPTSQEEVTTGISVDTVQVVDSQNNFVDSVITEPVYAPAKPSAIGNLIYGLQRRIFIIPGKIVSNWFQIIPERKPFLYGDGYRLLAKLRGHEHHSYSKELYPIINKKYARQGFKGSVNTASFMYDYANFGVWGLVLSGFILSFLFVCVEQVFSDNFGLKLGLNLYPILFLSSTALTTLLFSGGWAFLILFYLMFLKNKN